MPKIAYIDKTFRDDKLELIGIANGIVAEYEAQGYGLTLRQLYYQMVSRDIIPNNIRSYKNLGNLINDARLAGLVDWHAIEDRTRNLRRRPHWDVRPGEKWPAAMRITLMAIIAQADGLAMLDGWERSEGAQLEAHVARSLMMPVKTVNERFVQSVHDGLCGRTSRERCRAKAGRLSDSSYPKWMRAGTVWRGEYSMRSFSTWHKDASVCSLSAVVPLRRGLSNPLHERHRGP